MLLSVAKGLWFARVPGADKNVRIGFGGNRETSDWAGILNFDLHASDPRGRFLLA